MDNNQVIANGDTVIYSFQCSGNAGVWEFGSNVGTSKQSYCQMGEVQRSVQPRPVGPPIRGITFRSAIRVTTSGNVTYHSVWLDGEETPIGATVLAAFSLRWPAWAAWLPTSRWMATPGADPRPGDLDQLTLWRW